MEPKDILPNLRPDLRITYTQPNFSKEVLLDLRVTTPFEGTKSGNLSAPNFSGDVIPNDLHDKRAGLAYKEKLEKYQRACANLGRSELHFLPFIISSTGKIHKEGKKFLKELAAHGSEVRTVPQNTLYNYYLKIISISFIKLITRIIYAKATAISSGNTFNPRKMLRQGNFEAYEVGDPGIFYRNPFHSSECQGY